MSESCLLYSRADIPTVIILTCLTKESRFATLKTSAGNVVAF